MEATTAAATAPPQPATTQLGPPLPSLPNDVFLPIAAKLDAQQPPGSEADACQEYKRPDFRLPFRV